MSHRSTLVHEQPDGDSPGLRLSQVPGPSKPWSRDVAGNGPVALGEVRPVAAVQPSPLETGLGASHQTLNYYVL